jgi:hypothetical protein
MDHSHEYSKLRFRQHFPAVNRRGLVVGAGMAGFGLLWWVVPQTGMFWLLLLILAALVWMASFGWKAALAALVIFLQRLQQY